MLVYKAHPLASDPPGNIIKARAICSEISLRYPNIVPISPLLAFSFCREPDDREQAMRYCRLLLSECDEVWMTGDWQKSRGCQEELELAKMFRKPIAIYEKGEVIHITKEERSLKREVTAGK